MNSAEILCRPIAATVSARRCARNHPRARSPRAPRGLAVDARNPEGYRPQRVPYPVVACRSLTPRAFPSAPSSPPPPRLAPDPPQPLARPPPRRRARATATSTCGACGAAHGAGPCRKTTRVECEHEDIPSCACPTRRTLITSAVAFVPAFLAASGARAAVLPSPTAVDDMEKRKMAREEMLTAARAKAAAQAAPARRSPPRRASDPSDARTNARETRGLPTEEAPRRGGFAARGVRASCHRYKSCHRSRARASPLTAGNRSTERSLPAPQGKKFRRGVSRGASNGRVLNERRGSCAADSVVRDSVFHRALGTRGE